MHPALNMRPPLRQQCRSGPDRCVHHPQHRSGEDAVRGRGGHLPDCQDAAHPETGHRPDRGELPSCYPSNSSFISRNTCLPHLFIFCSSFTHSIFFCLPSRTSTSSATEPVWSTWEALTTMQHKPDWPSLTPHPTLVHFS